MNVSLENFGKTSTTLGDLIVEQVGPSDIRKELNRIENVGRELKDLYNQFSSLPLE